MITCHFMWVIWPCLHEIFYRRTVYEIHEGHCKRNKQLQTLVYVHVRSNLTDASSIYFNLFCFWFSRTVTLWSTKIFGCIRIKHQIVGKSSNEVFEGKMLKFAALLMVISTFLYPEWLISVVYPPARTKTINNHLKLCTLSVNQADIKGEKKPNWVPEEDCSLTQKFLYIALSNEFKQFIFLDTLLSASLEHQETFYNRSIYRYEATQPAKKLKWPLPLTLLEECFSIMRLDIS